MPSELCGLVSHCSTFLSPSLSYLKWGKHSFTSLEESNEENTQESTYFIGFEAPFHIELELFEFSQLCVVVSVKHQKLIFHSLH